MFSISHALIAADAVKVTLDEAVRNGDFTQNHVEEVEASTAKEKVGDHFIDILDVLLTIFLSRL